MIIRTENIEEMEKDLNELLNIKCSLKEYFTHFEQMYNCIMNFDERFRNDVDFLIKEKREEVTEIYAYHLARLISVPKKLYPLKELLTTHNDLTDFLSQHRIYFREKNNELILYINDREIKREEIQSSNRHLFTRIGYYDNVQGDYCINGFAFFNDIKNNSDDYYLSLINGPEILFDLDIYINEKTGVKSDLCQEYMKRTDYYSVVFKAPLSEIIFDGKDNIIKEEKEHYFLQIALYNLYCFYHSKSYKNIGIRLDNEKSIEVDHCIHI
ncbi:hypothetical protein [Massilimicrobiota timonensis]|uniref:hypothetical protein n=1 Tax=Massilimicrobiota timonensis TaxID=1776392 RepID=UPI00101C8202|nr:hypothetical protein [Massilimicrobiota timonensis]